jgi:hypothetical protein
MSAKSQDMFALRDIRIELGRQPWQNGAGTCIDIGTLVFASEWIGVILQCYKKLEIESMG